MDEKLSSSEDLSQSELDRLWQHGLHEERLFHDRLNYFSIVELGLLSAFAILYNKEQPFVLLTSLAIAALAFTLFWLALQYKHWKYCLFLNLRMRQEIPEFRNTVDTYFRNVEKDKQVTAISYSQPLSLAPPVLFALTWIAFLLWTVSFLV
ncbi:MAG TPA: hypothetical protein VJV05_17590 [Pyrinomonadaceae bacterium]|nr:hypothetical protein [Pyrinomonadaceae bacterium]